VKECLPLFYIQERECERMFTIILYSGKRMCVGYDDGTLKVWDLKTATVQHNLAGMAVLFLDKRLVN